MASVKTRVKERLWTRVLKMARVKTRVKERLGARV